MAELRSPTKEEEKILLENHLTLLDERGNRNFSVLTRDKNSIELFNHKSGCKIEIRKGQAPW